MERDEQTRGASPRRRQPVPSERPSDHGQRGADERVGNPRDCLTSPEQSIERREKRTVTDGVVAPWMPYQETSDGPIVRVSQTRSDAPRAEVVVMPIPYGLPRPRER